MRFTDKGIQGLKAKPERYIAWKANGDGLGVRVAPTGKKTFVFMYRFEGRARMLSLGEFGRGKGKLSLADAGEAHAAARKLLEQGIDPGEKAVEKRQDARKAPTVAELGDRYIEQWAKPRKRSWSEDRRILDHDVIPAWGRRKAADVTRRDVIALLDEIAGRAPIQANRTFALVRRMFRFAVEKDVLPSSPCVAIRPPATENRRDRVLSAAEIRALWHALDDLDAEGAERAKEDRIEMSPGLRLTLKLQLLTAARKGEVAGARWSEIDLPSRWWTIPAERAKNGTPHRVPLSPQAVALLEDIKAAAGDSEWLFPGRAKANPITPEAVNHAVRKNLPKFGIGHFTPHDLRRSVATGLAENGTPRLVLSKVLNHVDRTVTAVYDVHTYDREKRAALEAWGRRLDFILTGNADEKVIELAREAG